MHRLRTTWLALAGGALLVTLSISTAFGAPPEKDGPPGQKVSGFVHELIFGSDEETDEDEVVEEEPADEDESTDDEDGSEDDEDTEEAVDEEVDEDGEETADRQVPDEFANHGECVSAATQDTEGFEDSESANKGEWVSMHARYVCWGLDVPEEESEEDVDDADAEDADEASAMEEAKAERAAARAERKAARAAAREERAAARAERNAERHVARAANRGGGRGNGR